MSDSDPAAIALNQNGNKGAGMSLDSWENLSNAAFFTFTALALAASVVVFLVARASTREKDRELERYKAEAGARVAEADARASQAHAVAEQARAAAEEARLEAATAKEQLARTQIKLNERSQIQLLPEERVARLSRELPHVNLVGVVLVAAASSDPESQARASQVDQAITKSGVHRELGNGVTGYIPSAGDKGDFVVVYHAERFRKVATELHALLRRCNFDASLRFDEFQGPEDMRDVSEDIVEIAALARAHPSY